MATINFPDSPAVNDTFSANGVLYQWDGVKWQTMANVLEVSAGGTSRNTLTANSLLAGNGTSAVNLIAPSTAGNVLASNGTAWVSQANPPAFPAGTLMLFQQTSAPTGWTKQTTHDNKALRVVSGTASSGGTTGFTSVFTNQTPTITTSGLSVGATTLSTAQMPSHNHGQSVYYEGGDGLIAGGQSYFGPTGYSYTGSTGGGGSHTHSLSGSATSSEVTLNIAYVDLIIASKD